MVRNDVNGEFRDIPVLKENVIFEEFPNRIEPEPLSSHRQKNFHFLNNLSLKIIRNSWIIIINKDNVN